MKNPHIVSPLLVLLISICVQVVPRFVMADDFTETGLPTAEIVNELANDSVDDGNKMLNTKAAPVQQVAPDNNGSEAAPPNGMAVAHF